MRREFKRKDFWILLIIFLVGFIVRIWSTYPANTVVGFDQARDFFDARKIVTDSDLRIVGPTAGNNPDLHHGVAFLYYIIPPVILGGGNPFWVVVWNSFFSAGIGILIYFFAKSLFEDKITPIVSGIVVAVSYYFVEYAGWLSNPTVALLTTPIFFYGLWQYYKGKAWGLPVSFFFMGLSIEFELFMIYLIPTFIIAWLILKPKLPNLKLFLTTILAFTVSVSTMILTEIKYNFAGIKSILYAGELVGGEKKPFFDEFILFVKTRWEAFSLNLYPQNKEFGAVFGVIVVGFLIIEAIRNRSALKRNLFLLLIFFSPAIMLLLGVHNAPWFLIGRPISVILMSSYLISKIRPKIIIFSLLICISVANLTATKNALGKGQPILEPDPAAILSTQVSVVEYTYQKSNGETFAIDTVTNPLYVNSVWAWNYEWISNKHNVGKPGFLGGDQLPPYDTLPKANGREKYFFIITDKTPRIPPVYKQNAISSMKKIATFVEEKDFGGITVSMWKNKK